MFANFTSRDFPTNGHCLTLYSSNQHSSSVGPCAEETDGDLSFFTKVSPRKINVTETQLYKKQRQSSEFMTR